jgi:hypothetical protein
MNIVSESQRHLQAFFHPRHCIRWQLADDTLDQVKLDRGKISADDQRILQQS